MTARAFQKSFDDGARPIPPPVDAAFVRELIRQRAAHSRVASADYFTDPPWDLLLELTAAHLEERQVTLAGARSSTNVAEGAAERWIHAMVRDGLLVRRSVPGALGGLRIALAPDTLERMLDYLASAARALRSA